MGIASLSRWSNETDEWPRRRAGRCEVRAATIEQITGLYRNCCPDVGTRHRRDDRDLHPGSPGHAAIAGGREAGAALAHRRRRHVLLLDWIYAEQSRGGERLDAVLVGSVPTLPRRHRRVRAARRVPGRHG